MLILRLIVLFFLILAISGTIYWYTGRGTNFDYAIVIDASASMMAEDYQPNRLESAKEAALNFVDSLKGRSRIAVTSFTGTTFIEQRLTDDLSQVKKAINSIQLKEIGGTALGDALLTTSNVIFERKKANVIILLTDGQNTIGASPETAIKYLNENKVLVYTIGIGTKEGGEFVKLPPIISRLDEDTLKMIAEETGGKYFLAKDKTNLKAIYKEIASYNIQRLSENLATPFMLFALIALLIEWGLMNSKYRSLP